MYKHNQKIKYNECLICFSSLLKKTTVSHLIYPMPICLDCIQRFSFINRTILFHQYPLHILYKYNDFFKGLLYQYKGMYDYALKDVFLCLYENELKKKYKDYVVAVAPSSKEDNQKRGFSPMETLSNSIFDNTFTGLYKVNNFKQSDYTFEKRKMVEKNLSIKDKEKLKGKNVLIIDDVLTSGETLKTCLMLVLSAQPKHVELLVLSTKQDLKELENRANTVLIK